MPATVKVKVVAGRDLPVMDRSSELTDAFVEVGLVWCCAIDTLVLPWFCFRYG